MHQAVQFQRLFELRPPNRDHIPALRTAVGVAVPLFVLLAIGRMDLAMCANFGSFAGIYGRHEGRRIRVTNQIIVGAMLATCVTLGASMSWWHASSLVVTLVTSVISCATATVVNLCGLRPAGSVFFVFCTAAIGSLPQGPNPVDALLAALASSLFCVALGLGWHLLGEGDVPGGPLKRAPRPPRPTVIASAVRFFVAPLIAGLLGLLSVGFSPHLSHPYWAMIAAVVAFIGPRYLVQYQRVLQRVLGTLTGVLLAGFLLSHGMDAWQLIIWVTIIQFLTELTVTRNYVVGSTFITPIALLMVHYFNPLPIGELMVTRSIETIVGSAAALGVIMISFYWDHPKTVHRYMAKARPRM